MSMIKDLGSQSEPPICNRRAALQLASLAVVSTPLVVACGGPETRPGAKPSVPGNVAIATTADIPQGSARIIAEHKVVITNDPPGNFQGFSYLCTHMGCPVTTVEDEKIECNCHGSVFSTKDGSVTKGPASRPLEQLDLRIEGDSIFLA